MAYHQVFGRFEPKVPLQENISTIKKIEELIRKHELTVSFHIKSKSITLGFNDCLYYDNQSFLKNRHVNIEPDVKLHIHLMTSDPNAVILDNDLDITINTRRRNFVIDKTTVTFSNFRTIKGAKEEV